ncbi:hypothetical protein [Micromonospora profundi]
MSRKPLAPARSASYTYSSRFLGHCGGAMNPTNPIAPVAEPKPLIAHLR